MIKVEPMSALKNADFILDMLSELRLNGVVKMSMVTNADNVTEAVQFLEKLREVAYKELSLDY
jgi:hypothetical protein